MTDAKAQTERLWAVVESLSMVLSSRIFPERLRAGMGALRDELHGIATELEAATRFDAVAFLRERAAAETNAAAHYVLKYAADKLAAEMLRSSEVKPKGGQ